MPGRSKQLSHYARARIGVIDCFTGKLERSARSYREWIARLHGEPEKLEGLIRSSNRDNVDSRSHTRSRNARQDSSPGTSNREPACPRGAHRSVPPLAGYPRIARVADAFARNLSLSFL